MRFVVITLATLVFTTTLAEAAPLRLRSGLHGVVMRGPTKPVCMESEPCEEPAAGVVLQFKRAGRLMAEVKTGRVGTYTVKLRPGTYTVTAPQRRIGTGLTPRVVRVREGRLGRVNFHLDTGIQ
jgi:hypothetical protein